MARYDVPLLARTAVARDTWEFTFARPAGFRCRAGQYVDLIVADGPGMDAEGPLRSFSLVNAPDDDALVVVMRMRDTAFKRALAALPVGGTVGLDGPDGCFTLDDDGTPAACIAGGTGIAPFLSLFGAAVAAGRALHAALFYANRRPEDAFYLDRLERLARADPTLVVVPTITRPEASAAPWRCERGPLGVALWRRHLPALASRRWYIAGSPGLVAGTRRALRGAGVEEEDIRVEMFGGY